MNESSVTVSLTKSGEISLSTTLKNQIGRKKKITLKVIAKGNRSLDIVENGDPIAAIEMLGGQLRLLVWANKNSDEVTHIIKLNRE